MTGAVVPGFSGAAHYQALAMWVIYDHPRDLPAVYVARRWEMQDGQMRATGTTLQDADLDMLRATMRARGLFRIERDPRDDPVIIECWL